MSGFKKNGLPAILSIVVIAVMYYALIPPINGHSTEFWWFLIYCIVVVIILFALPRMKETGENIIGNLGDTISELFDKVSDVVFRRRRSGGREGSEKRKKSSFSRIKKGSPLFVALVAVVVVLVIIFGGTLISSPFFNAKAYSRLLDVQEGEFSEDIAEIPMSSVPVVDRDTAVRLGSRTIGEMSDLVSQYAIDESSNAYTQINYQDGPYRVSSLRYADIIKWITNTRQGLPGFVTVNMASQETKLVRLPEGQYMRYSTGEHFNRLLQRYVRFQYPTEIFGEAAFEIDDNGVPYWIVPTVKFRIMLFGGEDYDGAILVNAVTGETVKYDLDEIPNWCDKIYSADLVYDQLANYGKYRSGFWNSLIGQSGVQCPTGADLPSLFGDAEGSGTTFGSTVASGYNYLAINDDVYMYTGMTSANSDESLVGFVLINLRTKATNYYICAGATESSAMSSAQGQVQQMEYVATSPLLLNIADRPAYFLSLKDDAGLVKMYAFIDVQRYQIVGTGATIEEAQSSFIAALGSDSEVDVDADTLADAAEAAGTSETGKVASLFSVVRDGNTCYYFTFEGSDQIYIAPITVSDTLPFLKSGDEITVTFNEGDTAREVTALS